jgi:MatE
VGDQHVANRWCGAVCVPDTPAGGGVWPRRGVAGRARHRGRGARQQQRGVERRESVQRAAQVGGCGRGRGAARRRSGPCDVAAVLDVARRTLALAPAALGRVSADCCQPRSALRAHLVDVDSLHGRCHQPRNVHDRCIPDHAAGAAAPAQRLLVVLAVGQSLVGVAMARASACTPAHGTEACTDAELAQCGAGARASGRRIGDVVIALSVLVSAGMALATWLLRGAVPRLFTQSATVLALVERSALLMCLILAVSWNNGIEGVLMGVQDTQFVINIYPVCVAVCVAVLAATIASGWALQGIWAALLVYYAGLTSLMSGRYWLARFRKRI